MVESDLHGSAKIFTEGNHDLLKVLHDGGPSVVLGLNTPRGRIGLSWGTDVLQGHGLTFGATRSGKGVTAIIPALLTYTGSAVVIDPKGENAWVTAERRRQLGQRVVILDPWGEVNRRYGAKVGVTEQTTRFNPLSGLRPSDPDFADDVNALADALIISSAEGPNSHWSESARELVKGLIAVLIEIRPGKASLKQVRRLLSAPADDLASILDKVHASNPNSLGVRLLRRFTVDNRETGSIRSVALTQTAFLDTETLLDAMETDDPPFDFRELITGRVTLFLVLPLDRLNTHGRWLRLLLTLAIRTIARSDTPPHVPVLFLMDEFGTVGRLEVVERAFGLMAGIGIRLWAFLQDLNQLKSDYPNTWETFIANSSIITVLAARDVTTSEYISRYLGNRTVVHLNSQTANDAAFFQKRTYPTTEDHFYQVPLVDPDLIRRYNFERVLIIPPGYPPSTLCRIEYYNHPAFVGKFRPMPAFSKSKGSIS